MNPARLKSQLEQDAQYTRMQRFDEEDPAYVTSYLHDVDTPEGEPCYTIIVDVFDNGQDLRVVPFVDMESPYGTMFHLELGDVDSLQSLEELLLCVWRSLQLGSTTYLT